MMNGAQPTDTCRAILSYKGIMLKKHLLEGVKKGALTEAQVEQKFNKWLQEKEGKVNAKKDRVAGEDKKVLNERLKAETSAKEAKAAKIAAKVTAAAETPAETSNESETPAADENQA
jgi:small subunit ribosomal protein S16